MHTRRQALGALLLPIACAPRAQWVGPGATRVLPPAGRGAPDEVARDEDYWSEVARAFTVDRSAINLNNASLSPSPGIVQEAMSRHLTLANSTPSAHAQWMVAPPLREAVRQRLAAQWGVDAEEIAITRNAAEGLQICQLGIDLARGDEVLATTQDYPHMIATFQQRERREGIVLRQFNLPVPAEDLARIVSLYESNITPRTRLILITHMINLTGQIMPVREVVAMARRHGIPVIVDGAQSLGHFDFKISDLDCDYFATSLHKWMCAPHGTGLLYVRRDKIRGLWPLMAAPADLVDNIRKFEEVGTNPPANALAVAEALTFHQAIGGARKEARLIHLRETWTKRLLAAGGRLRMQTSLRPGPPRLACSIATFELEGVDTMKLWAHLWDKYRILTGAVVRDEVRGLRVSPSVYTTPEELDRFCTAIEQVVRRGLPA
jgi:selenocysteine lyase/cysteine desulfurase